MAEIVEESIDRSEINGNYATIPPRELENDDLIFLHEWTNHQYDDEYLKKHILDLHEVIREKEHVYRCISAFAYLSPKSHLHPSYSQCLERLNEDRSRKILDLGTCFGQEVRQLIVNGVLPEQITASDVVPVYWEAGIRLYLDDRPPIKSSRGIDRVNVCFGDWAATLGLINGNDISTPFESYFDVIMCWSVFHVLSKEQVDAMIKRIWKVLKPGGVLIGATNGSKEAKQWLRTPDNLAQRYLHDKDTLTVAFREGGFANEVNVIPIDRGFSSHWRLKERNIAGDERADRQEMIRLAFAVTK